MFKHAKIIDEIAIKQNSVQSLMKRRPMRISVIQCCLNVLKGDLQTHSKSNNKRRTKFTIKTHDLESNVKKTTSAHSFCLMFEASTNKTKVSFGPMPVLGLSWIWSISGPPRAGPIFDLWLQLGPFWPPFWSLNQLETSKMASRSGSRELR